MAELVTQGMLTITDETDAPRISCIIVPSTPAQQVFFSDGNSYRPNWAVTPLLLSPAVTVNGTAISDLTKDSRFSNFSWKLLTDTAGDYVDALTLDGFSKSGDDLKIAKNMTDDAAWHIIFRCKYTDTNQSLLTLNIEASISISKIENGGGVAFADIEATNGTEIKNGTPEALVIRGVLIKGGVVDTNFTASDIANRMAWYEMDPEATGDSNFSVEAGWKKITNNIIYFTDRDSGLPAGYCQLTVPPSAIVNLNVFLFVAKDINGNIYRRTITLTDSDDPYYIFMETPFGTAIKNSQGTLTIKAHIYQAGEELDAAGTKYTYKWYKRDVSTGNEVKWLNDDTGAEEGYERTGQTLTIKGGANIDGKLTVHCRVYTKATASIMSRSIFGHTYSLVLEYDPKTTKKK